MSIKSKIISLSAVFALALTFASQGALAATTPFTDIDNVAAKEKIISLQEKGFVNGIGNNLFAPDSKLTAAEGIQLIVNALDLNLDLVRFFKEPKATDYFKKADDSAWYADALIIASVNGMDLPADLDPNEEWTREEFTYRFLTAMETHANLPMVKIMAIEIADNSEITVSYQGAIQLSLFYGITTLDAKKNFHPKDILSRADAAEQIYNALGIIDKYKPGPRVIID